MHQVAKVVVYGKFFKIDGSQLTETTLNAELKTLVNRLMYEVLKAIF